MARRRMANAASTQVVRWRERIGFMRGWLVIG
jgi:hypothetical protein